MSDPNANQPENENDVNDDDANIEINSGAEIDEFNADQNEFNQESGDSDDDATVWRAAS